MKKERNEIVKTTDPGYEALLQNVGDALIRGSGLVSVQIQQLCLLVQISSYFIPVNAHFTRSFRTVC